jgi:hypothetical protein
VSYFASPTLSDDIAEETTCLAPSPLPSHNFPVPLPFANPPLFSLPHANMEPWSAKKAKQDMGNLTQDDSDVIRKLMVAFEKQLKLKN